MSVRILSRVLGQKLVHQRVFSSAASDSRVVLTDDNSTLVIWHPKQDFPYEHTRPLPEIKLEESTSVLKTQLTPELMSVFNKKTPEQARQELMNITHTTKHRWFPRARDKKAKKTPMDREYL
ncbi:39S ribosomal protein L42, mitochondrial [Aethina tumida]|uniref:39S ribosomal protein L42, mitochondrial n=1 Tax=Aethina tumida TaxID=116153 RepID=UPI00096B603D|nr:39S ribosomal protein L42, mitochondrial [Aethina tumida]